MIELLENPPLFSTQIEAGKVAADNGYRIAQGTDGAWLRFSSTTAPYEIAIAYGRAGDWLLQVKHPGVSRELAASALHTAGNGIFLLPTLHDLHQVLDRVYRLSLSLPNAPLQQFQAIAAKLPRSTEVERLVVQRVGQDIFRTALLDYWGHRCPLTGITEPALLRASHIVPWAQCESDAMRLDVYNGLLLSSLWDAAFDAGLVSFSVGGVPLVSPSLSPQARATLALDQATQLRGLTPHHSPFLLRHAASAGLAPVDG